MLMLWDQASSARWDHSTMASAPVRWHHLLFIVAAWSLQIPSSLGSTNPMQPVSSVDQAWRSLNFLRQLMSIDFLQNFLGLSLILTLCSTNSLQPISSVAQVQRSLNLLQQLMSIDFLKTC